MEQSGKITNRFELYLKCSQLAESSIAIKSRALGYFCELYGDCEVKEITYGRAEDYRNYLLKGRSEVSVNIYLKNFAPFFSWMVKRRFIDVNPFADLKLFSVDNKRPQAYTPEEIARLIMVADTRWRAIILLGLSSLRRAEILNLCVQDIRFDKNLIMITPKLNSEYTWSWRIKNHNQAAVPLPEKICTIDEELNLHRILIELIEWLPARQPYVFIKPDLYRDLIAKSKAGKLDWERRNNPWGNFSRDFRNLLKKAKVKTRRFHDLRGTFATRMSDHLPLRKIQKLMRHKSPQTTAGYIHVEEEQLVAESAQICEKCYM